MKDKILCVIEGEVQRNSVSMGVTMVLTQAQEELQYQLNKEVQDIQTSEGAVSYAVVREIYQRNIMLSMTVVRKRMMLSLTVVRRMILSLKEVKRKAMFNRRVFMRKIWSMS